MRLVVVGDVMVDVVASASVAFARGTDAAARVALRPGGSGQNVARWLAAAGERPALVCRLGTDRAGKEAAADLVAAGVELHAARDAEAATGVCVVVVEPGGERSFLPDRGANARLTARDVPEGLLAPGVHLHLSGYGLLDAEREAAESRVLLARAAAVDGCTVSLDPASAGPLARLGAERFLAWTDGVDLLLPNAEEARVLTGEADPSLAARRLARRADGSAREVVVTCGADGAVWSDGTDVVTQPAIGRPAARRHESADAKASTVGAADLVADDAANAMTAAADLVADAAAAAVDPVVDTTGAGDAFTAGLLAARARGASPAAALVEACALAARAVGVVGAAPPPPRFPGR